MKYIPKEYIDFDLKFNYDEDLFSDMDTACKVLMAVFFRFHINDINHQDGLFLFNRIKNKSKNWHDKLWYMSEEIIEDTKELIINGKITMLEGMKFLFELEELKSYGY